ncbi:hypothetical protein [Brevundimonas nasdae]|uniref:hypothetical protein n=1 Tax=Brevundimonas nasdae TaxID=172043 RepID=UPI00289F6734|nr:hypothetical protein [Brevundimonas nasdae]
MAGRDSGISGLNWRTTAIIVLSAGFNGVLIAALSFTDAARPPQKGGPTPTIFVEIEPRPLLAYERTPTLERATAIAPARNGPADAPSPPATTSATASAPSPPAPDPSDIEDRWRVAPRADTPSLRILSCDAPQHLSPEFRRQCDDRRLRLASDARSITGTGDADRDAAFARQGARRLAAWEAQRADPSRVAATCESPSPVAGCADVNIQVELFSSRDGFLPNLRKRRE